MALDLKILGLTGVQAAVKITNFTLDTTIDPHWVRVVSPSGSTFTPRIDLTLQAITTPDDDDNAPLYTNSKVIHYNRVGYMESFNGLNLKVRMPLPPFTYGAVATALLSQYGIVLEAEDVTDDFSQIAQIDEFNVVSFHTGLTSVRFYTDFSPFFINVTIDTTNETDLERLISMAQQANLSQLDQDNMPTGNTIPPGTPLLDQHS